MSEIKETFEDWWKSLHKPLGGNRKGYKKGAKDFSVYVHEKLDQKGEEINDIKEENKILQEKVNKLKSLILLTDPVVSNVAVSTTALEQWQEFINCYPDEGE